jgi:carbamoylphosphate synthase small subunit
VEITAHNHGFAVDAPLEGEIDSRTATAASR